MGCCQIFSSPICPRLILALLYFMNWFLQLLNVNTSKRGESKTKQKNKAYKKFPDDYLK